TPFFTVTCVASKSPSSLAPHDVWLQDSKFQCFWRMLRALAFLWLSANGYTPLRPHEGVSYALE
ncbi:unnamed protein product, partial [Symbiodinium sp. CCMP2456]